jgi:hypothetical protein
VLIGLGIVLIALVMFMLGRQRRDQGGPTAGGPGAPSDGPGAPGGGPGATPGDPGAPGGGPGATPGDPGPPGGGASGAGPEY